MDYQNVIEISELDAPQVQGGCIASLSVVANCSIRQMFFPRAGLMMEGHRHTFDHQTLVAHGAVRVSVNGIVRDFKAPVMLKITASDVHDLTALEDGTVCYCIHPIRNGERVEDIADPRNIPSKPYPIIS